MRQYSFRFILLISAIYLMNIGAQAQEKLKFQIESFSQDAFDTSATNPKYEKMDGNGDRYAIIKVKSTRPEDNLRQLTFNFGNMKHIVDPEDHNGELWVYVMRNAKTVTISRDGYYPINRYDLMTTIEPGKNYVMTINSQEKKTYRQMVRFDIKPENSGAAIMIKNTLPDSNEELFGYIGNDGSTARTLECGVYHYKIITKDYHTEEGKLTLSHSGPALIGPTVVESVSLRPNFSTVTLNVDADADIYIDGEHVGFRNWTGRLKPGRHEVECRQLNCYNSTQSFTIGENENQKIELVAPTPKVGYLAVTSTPLGADISIDNKSYGQTPQSFDIPIGKYELKLAKKDYKDAVVSIEILENGTTEISKELQLAPIKQSKDKEPKLKDDISKSANSNIANTDRLKNDNSTNFKRQKTVNFYAELGGVAGQTLGATADVGMYLHNFNVELDYTLGLKKSPEIYWYLYDNDNGSYSQLGHDRVDCKYKSDINVDLKLGYGFDVSSRIKLTPQVGAKFVKLSEINEYDYKSVLNGANAVDATVGLRLYCKISSHFGVSLTPNYALAITKSEGMKLLTDTSSEIKNMIEGFNAKLSLCLTF